MKKFLMPFIFILILGASFFVSCEVGLGQSVDTQPPTVDVTLPEADYVIRDAFVMSGNCNDEQGVAKIEVTLKNTSTKEKIGPFTAVINAETATWTCAIDPLDENMPVRDASYEATVVATDFANRTSKASRSFVVDNTPPVLILQRPSTKPVAGEIVSPDSYGQDFSIQGQTSDDNDVEKLVVTVYEEDGTKIRDIELKNIPATLNNSVAKWGTTDYSAIYGSNELADITKNRYCTVKIYDSARHCPEIENDEGNSTESYYLYTEYDADIGSDYKAQDLYHILNGSYGISAGRSLDAETAALIENIKETLSGLAIQQGTFSLNPANNPTYLINGFNTLPESVAAKVDAMRPDQNGNSAYSVMSGGSMNIRLSAGLDNKSITPSSLNIYLQPIDTSTNTISSAEATKVWLIKDGASAIKKDENGSLVDAASISPIGSLDYSINVVLTAGANGLEAGKYYILYVNGHDTGNQEFVNSARYGLCLLSSGSAPRLTITSATSQYLPKGAGLTITGTVSSEDQVTVSLKMIDNTTGNEVSLSGQNASYVCSESGSNAEEWSISLTSAAFNQTTCKDYEITVTASTASRSTERQVNVSYDVDGPNIEISSVSPLITADGRDNNINGTVAVRLNLSDDYYKLSSTIKPVVEFLDGDTVLASKEGTFTSTVNLEFDTNASGWVDNKEVTMKVTAYDFSGNKSVKTAAYYVNQATDRPLIELTNAVTTGYTESYPETGSENSFLAGAPITGKITEDDGIKSITYTIYKQDGSQVSTETISGSAINSNPYPLSITTPSDLGVYYAVIVAKDTKTEKENLPCKFYFMIDSGKPTITVTPSVNGTYYGKPGGTINVSGTVRGVGGLKVYRAYTSASSNTQISGTQPESTQGIDEDYIWEDAFPVPSTLTESSTKYTNKYKVVDKKNRISEASFNYFVDATAPSVVIGTANNVLVESTDFKFEGTASDTSASSSGLSSVWYKVLASTAAAPSVAGTESAAESAGWTKLSGTSTWNFYQSFVKKGGDTSSGALEEGSYKVYLCAYDNAQNASTLKSISFKVDLDKPEVTTSYKVGSDSTALENENQVLVKSAFTFAYTASDAWAPTATVAVSKDGTALAASAYTNTYSDGAGEVTISNISDASSTDGVYTFAVTAKDQNNKETVVTRNILLDRTAPSITILSPIAEGTNTSGWQAKQKVSVSGASEDSGAGIKAVYYTTDSTAEIGTASSWSNKWTKLSGTSSWKFETAGNTSQGEHTYYFAAVDNAGNVSSEKTEYVLQIDTANPAITSDTFKSFATNKAFTISGTATDSYKLKSISLVASCEGKDDVTLLSETGLSEGTKTWTTGSVAVGESNRITDGEWTLTLIVTDAADKSVEKTCTVTVDTVNPVISAATLNYNNKNAGTNGYYAYSTPTLTVTAADATSGISSVGYVVSTEVLYDDNNSEHIQISKDEESYTTLNPATANTFTKKISFADGRTYIYLRAEDAAGNVTYYGAGGTLPAMVDTTGPELAFNSPNASGMLSTNVACAFEIQVSDISVVNGRTATVKLAGNTVATPTVTGGKITGTIPQSTMATITENSASLSVTLADEIGNSSEKSLTLTFDNEAPSVSINNPAAATVNGNITISGTSGDNVEVDSLILYRTKVTGVDTEATTSVTVGETTYSDVYELASFSGAECYNWKYKDESGNAKTVNTAPYDGKTFKLIAIASDKAHNKIVTEKQITVDQDSDRPEIKFNNLNLTGMTSSDNIWHKSESIYGTVKDDDGVSEMYISLDGGTTWEADNLYDSGSWSYTFKNDGTDDGSKKIAFKVIDVSNGTDHPFISASGAEMGMSPKLIDSQTTPNKFGYKVNGSYPASSDTYVYMTLDTQQPVIKTVYYLSTTENITSSYAGVAYPPTDTTYGEWKADTTIKEEVFGGSGSYLYLIVPSVDKTGIKSCIASLADTDGTLIKTVSTTIDSKPAKLSLYKLAVSSGDGFATLKIKATDNADGDTQTTYNITLDNTAPSITITSHKDGAQVFGTRSVNVRGSADDIESLHLAVTKYDEAPATTSSSWTDISSYTSCYSFSVNFFTGSNSTGSTDYYAGLLSSWYKSLFYPSLAADQQIPSDASVEDMYVWFYGKDSLGNTGTPTRVKLHVIPTGGTPNVEIVYPTTSATVGGTIRVSGTAEIEEGTITGIYVQIDPNYEFEDSENPTAAELKGSNFNESWNTELQALLDAKDVDSYSITSGLSLSDSSKNYGTYGIRANANSNNTSWNLAINGSKEIIAGEDSKVVAVRVIAITNDKISEAKTVVFTIDADSPTIGDPTRGSLKLVKRQGDVSNGTILKTVDYTADMWISGIWFLTGSIYDDAGIKTVTINSGSNVVGNGTYMAVDNTNKPVSGDYHNYQLNMKVGSATGYGSLSYEIYAVEGTDNNLDTSLTVSINYDKEAPGFVTDLAASGNDVQNSNGTFAMSGTFNEDSTGSNNQSGFKRIAFYLTRTIGTTTYVIDPMIAQGSTGTSNRYDVASGFTTGTDDGMYWRSAEIDTNGINSTDVTLKSVPTNVRIGGLCKIDDVVFEIKGVSGKKITLDSAPVETTTTTAYFAVAQVINHLVSENFTTAAYDATKTLATSTNDDGDQMCESVTKSGTTWTWSAEFDSSLILDGPVDINFVAYDNAGNITKKTCSGTVKNNQPRIAGIKFGTDDDANGTVSDSELITGYSALYGERTVNGQTVKAGYKDDRRTKVTEIKVGYNEETSAWSSALNIKGDFRVVPEIVGGNNGISYNYTVTKDGASSAYVTEADLVELSAVHATGDAVRSGTTALSDITLSVKDMISAGFDDANKQKLKFSLWDKTEGTSQGLTSNCAVIEICANVMLKDTEDPVAKLHPFFWTSEKANSLFDNSTLNGHIELTTDLPSSKFGESSGEYDSDPKVSGQIVFRGKVTDNVLLDNITLTIPGFNSGNPLTVATYDSSSTEATDLAKWATGASLSNGAIPSGGWAAKILSSSLSNADGHAVEFELYFDTSAISAVAANDVAVLLKAQDRGEVSIDEGTGDLVYIKNDSDASSTTNTVTDAETCYYKVDVVPYITGITTELSSGNKKRPTILSRSALGYYPVRRGSSLTVNGFNLNGTSSRVDIGSSTNLTPTNESTKNSLIVSVGTATTFMTGNVVAKVGDSTNGYVVSLNNDTAKSVTTGTGANAVTRIIEYNTEPNGQNNDLLTDERRVKVVDVYTTTDPEDKRMLDMAINGNSINFSAGYKDAYFSVMLGASGTSVGTISNLRNSYTRYFDNAIALNESGTPFTVSACGDTLGTPVSSWNNGPSQFALRKGTANTGRNYIWEYNYISNNTTLLVLDSNWNGADLNNLDRFKWPDIVVTGQDSATKGYISYYDTTQKLIKFRYFTSTTNTVASNLASYRNGSTATQYVEGAVNTNATYSQGYTAIAGANENSPYSAVNVTSGGAALVAWYDASNGALKMKYNTSPATSFSGYQTFSTVPDPGTVTFKLSVDGVKVVNEDGTDKVLSVTYSKPTYGDNKHEFAYQLNSVLSNGYGAYAEVDPKNNVVTVRSMQTGTGSSIAITITSNSGAVNAAVAGAGAAWNTVTIDEDSAGQYVAMKTDSKGGIHFAYYDTGNGDLKYAYMSSVTATPVVVIVDGYQQVGQYIDLALKETTSGTKTNVTPYISYYSMSNADTKRAAKVAKLASPIVYTGTTPDSSAVTDGSEDELFTGAWEAMHIPTNGIPVQYRVNIGVTSAGNVYVSYLADRIIEYVKVE